ncbi:mitochondrial import inner membrane translocase subunit Tim29-like [Argiope bruennichi]|uniref:mitochondrial import inner membrane translocase subunit Tim29-like n=1 Tax=Argiope bruennichi TaxID=94029 RepID=UPI00249424E6|nr:mitochondrial import inner membrane translocase subunit Tim29-like [Argiope bruennichi]
MLVRRILTFPQTLIKRVVMIKQKINQAEEGTRLHRWREFWLALIADYKSVGMDVIQGSKERPKKAVLITSGLGIMFGALITNPDEQSFYDQHIKNSSTLVMVTDPIRNPAAEEHITYLTRCENQGLLRHTNLLFFSLMWVADYDKNCDIYAQQCKYLRPKFLTFYQRIVDVGLFGRWLNLKFKMKDFDINPNEWNEKS